MRLLLVTVLLEALFALLLADHLTYMLLLGPIALFAVVLAIRRESLILAPLLLALPIIPLMVTLFPLRLFGVTLATALILFAASDISHRHKGAPLSFTRLLLWYLSGSFVLFTALFAAAADHVLSTSLLLSAAVIVAAGAVWLGRTTAERARAAEEHRVPRIVDAMTLGVLFAEVVVSLAFFPLSPIPLAALSVSVLWLLVRIIVASRLGQLTYTKLTGLLVNVAIVAGAVVLPTFFL